MKRFQAKHDRAFIAVDVDALVIAHRADLVGGQETAPDLAFPELGRIGIERVRGFFGVSNGLFS